MKVTYMRINGKKPTSTQMDAIIRTLSLEFERLGFVTYVDALNSTSLNISLGGKCFTVDTEKLGYNASVGFSNGMGYFYDNSGIKGYKRTSIPTWDQRVDFNDTLNKILDDFEVTANIKSGPYTIRCREKGAYDENDWENQTPYHSYSYAIERIVELTDDMISEGKEKLKAHRIKQKRLKKEALVRNITDLKGKSTLTPCFI